MFAELRLGELLAQTGKQNMKMRIIISLKPFKVIKLSSIISNWWENYKY